MERKNAESTPAISLPKGGGAIKGIGETFQPNLFTGTGNFSIPIYTSPGRDDFGPKLNLQYSSGNGNGPFGVGWQLSIPRITRKTEKGLPRYQDDDVFVMSGAEDLVPVLNENGDPIDMPDQGDYVITRYCPRTEGLFARIECWQHTSNHDDIFWRVATKENITNIYGKSMSARIADPYESTRIYEWLLEETFDAKGNHVRYEYIQENPDLIVDSIHERNRCPAQTYLRRILYGNTPDDLEESKKVGPVRTATDHTHLNNTKTRHYVFEVVFDYFDLPDLVASGDDWRRHDEVHVIPDSWPSRPDPFSTFRSGFEIRTLRRCRRVLMLHHFNEGELVDAPLVKSTDFDYNLNPDTKLTFLASATVQGYRKDPDDATRYLSRGMPPVTFKYSAFEPEKQTFQSVSFKDNDRPPIALTDPNTTLMDMFGDGLPDIVQSSEGGMYFWENLGSASFDRRRPQHGAQPPVVMAQENVAIGDMGGDGLVDLVVDAPPMSGFYEATPDGQWKTFKRFDSMPSFNLADPNTRLVDLTGDGLSDVLVTDDDAFIWFRAKGEAGFAEPERIPRLHDLNEFPDVVFSDPRVRLADLSGDGLNDIVLVHDGRIDYWTNLGYGRFGRRLTMSNTPRIGYDYDPKRLFLVDLDGSGTADLVYVELDHIRFWFNQSGNSWSDERVIRGTPYVSDMTSVMFADFFGSGTASLVWSYNYGAVAGSNYKVLDFCGKTKPNLLIEMDNNMGATTRAQYAPSTKYYLEDKRNGHPWVSTLPFPVQVLEKTEVIDHISKTKLTTTYKYHHGYYDGREREFRGFGRVDQYDTEEFDIFSNTGLHENNAAFTNKDKAYYVPPVLTKNWFHTGIYFDDDRRAADGETYDRQDMLAAYRREYYQGDPRAFQLADNVVPVTGTPHEAYRTLRGALLRSEIYALDGTYKAEHPYTVSETRNEVKELQARHRNNNHAVYFSVNKESITYQYDRNYADPRINQTLALSFDEYGNITHSVNIAYPRRPTSPPRGRFTSNEQCATKVTYGYNRFINKDDSFNYYYISIPCETKAFEVHGLSWSWPLAGEALLVPLQPFNESAFDGLNDVNDFEPFEYSPPDGLTTSVKRLLDWTRNYWRTDNDPEIIDSVYQLDHRLPLGQIQPLGLSFESYQAPFNTLLLQHIFQDKHNGIDLQNKGGFYFEEEYWWVPSGRQAYAPNRFYSAVQMQDPFGNRTHKTPDVYALLLTSVEDPLQNRVTADNDYRVLQAFQTTDINHNRSEARFDALGMVVGTAVMGKTGENKGDSLAEFQSDLTSEQIDDFFDAGDPHNPATTLLGNATSRIIYDLDRFYLTRDANPDDPAQWEPVFAAILARETHVNDSLLPNGLKIRISFSYSDGFGREIQQKIQAEPGSIIQGGPDIDPRWVGSGWTIFNNKGKPVRQYEPFFSNTHRFEFAKIIGVSPILFYDPLERVVATLNPNHTYEKVVFDPWQQETWDVNDTVLQADPKDDPDVGDFFQRLDEHDYLPTWHQSRINGELGKAEKKAAAKAAKHANTPTVAHFDTLGRTFLTVADNGLNQNGNEQKYKTRVELDIEGNQRKVIDARGRIVMTYDYDMLGNVIHTESMDAGKRWMFNNVAGNPIRLWDSRSHEISYIYDVLQRPTHVLVSTGNGRAVLAERMVYGEGHPSAKMLNLRGNIYQQYDGAGVVTNEEFDFKGNLLKSTRRLAKNERRSPRR